ncbi:hypothetical protein ILUMI_11090 [Ignelater luminosus]|uniref:Uncharacterized protein n=1 Tax=Ignelater luminosus TaxID=2038154 RepID=A0A8K0CWQ0_IGNLU|nr:hypothetical protein ILUMI_11090 [Ignelater luminosus]
MHLTALFLLFPFCSAFYSFTGSTIEMIDHKKWKDIATGNYPYIWMINFYCAKAGDKKCKKSEVLKDEYTDAVAILKGLVKPAAYKVNSDFPAFVRIPSVMLYVPNSTEPYVFELENFPEQVKRPSFRLVHFVQDLVINHIKSDQVRHVTSSWKLNQLRTDWMQKVVYNEIPNQCTFVLMYDDFKKEQIKLQLLAAVATAVYSVHGISNKQINFGVANFRETKDAFKDIREHYTVPKFMFFGPRNAPANKQLIFGYDGRMDVADMTRWIISRHADMMIIPGDTVQINIKREAGFVGQVINIDDRKFYIGTH